MINEILKELKNYFETSEFVKKEFVVENGTIIGLPFLQNQYVKIEGSILNDGIYKMPLANLQSEKFQGTIIGLAIPKEVISLEVEIKAYKVENPKNNLASESFGGYTYNKSTNSKGQVSGWKDAFKEELNNYRKI
ncbi:MAG: hypothetical protein RR664_06370 [Clostridia bacterium]